MGILDKMFKKEIEQKENEKESIDVNKREAFAESIRISPVDEARQDLQKKEEKLEADRKSPETLNVEDIKNAADAFKRCKDLEKDEDAR